MFYRVAPVYFWLDDDIHEKVIIDIKSISNKI